ncbi:hypothetical protein M758_7G136700 [Ceratodon purpureus]|nr:hypothetical protein M758_7G136700 [Ceratodon purpureus]
MGKNRMFCKVMCCNKLNLLILLHHHLELHNTRRPFTSCVSIQVVLQVCKHKLNLIYSLSSFRLHPCDMNNI